MNFIKKFRVKPGRTITLARSNPSFTAGLNKLAAQAILKKNIKRLVEQQTKLYADNRQALLVIFQGMDTSGKDGAIRHVMSGINPQGCTVTSFKAPSHEELDHDYLWRIHKWVPPKGDIGIFNRSHYEDLLIVRVKKLVPRQKWQARYEQINQFEKMLAENGVVILKFFLHISKGEQKERLEARLNNPLKNWKFDPNDLIERKLWREYMKAYEEMLNRCSTAYAPWFIIPANKKWFRNLAVSEIIDETLEGMNLRFPKPKISLSKIKIK